LWVGIFFEHGDRKSDISKKMRSGRIDLTQGALVAVSIANITLVRYNATIVSTPDKASKSIRPSHPRPSSTTVTPSSAYG
jgi:hypothetical protein